MRNFVVLIGLLFVLGLGAFMFMRLGSASSSLIDMQPVSLPDQSDASATPDVPPALASSTPETQPVGENARLYKNSKFHFSLVYPKELAATEYKESGEALTVTFFNSENTESFQVYVTPYSDKQITSARFKTDEPSGVYQQPTNIVVDGTRATMFFSKNAIMGDTREVWFIRGGYLYEVTTYKELDTWLGNIMKTWKFI